ncbi:MAG: hypothetical protein JXL97_13925 [Bacteroidales bacterium]|nr:hypothetical protein [Bacteroidales bacterium]
MATHAESFWSFASKLWILSIVIFAIWAFSANYKNRIIGNENQQLKDSLTELNEVIVRTNEEKLLAFNFINSSTIEMNTLFQQIDIVKQNVNSMEEDERIKNLKQQIILLQNQANTLNNQITSMKKTLNSSQKKGKSY